MSKYNLLEVTDDKQWDAFVDASPEATVFSYSNYLKSLNVPSRRWLIRRGIEVKSALSLIEDPETGNVVLDDFVIYNGLFHIPYEQEQKRYKKLSDQFSIFEFVIEELTKKYKSIELSLAPQLTDIRPALWFNYHEKDSPRINVSNRFTSYLDISGLENYADFEQSPHFKQVGVKRQRNIRKAFKQDVKIDYSSNINQFIDFYGHLMDRQGSAVSELRLKLMEDLIKGLLDKNLAKMYVAKNGGQDAYCVIHCFDKKRAYYLFGAGCPQNRDQIFGSMAFWGSFVDLAKLGHSTLDLEGINSPNRGDFKLSFGGTIEHYFELSYDASSTG